MLSLVIYIEIKIPILFLTVCLYQDTHTQSSLTLSLQFIVMQCILLTQQFYTFYVEQCFIFYLFNFIYKFDNYMNLKYLYLVEYNRALIINN
jgi:hypothetical protein